MKTFDFLVVVLLLGSGGTVSAKGAYDTDAPASSSEDVIVYRICFNCQFYNEISMINIEGMGAKLIADSRSYFAKRLRYLLQVAEDEGFKGATKYVREFDAGKVRAKIEIDGDTYFIDWNGTLLKEPNRTYAMSKETFLDISQLFWRFGGVADMSILKKREKKAMAKEEKIRKNMKK